MDVVQRESARLNLVLQRVRKDEKTKVQSLAVNSVEFSRVFQSQLQRMQELERCLDVQRRYLAQLLVTCCQVQADRDGLLQAKRSLEARMGKSFAPKTW